LAGGVEDAAGKTYIQVALSQGLGGEAGIETRAARLGRREHAGKSPGADCGEGRGWAIVPGALAAAVPH
jgi:hypothetical protein